LYIISLVAVKFFPPFSLMMVFLPLYAVVYRLLAARAGANMNYLCDVVADGEYLLWGPVIFIGKIF
ncbi:MAG: hypothetical protein ACREBS_11050, partial [Nitrososphaerales archaeon]